MEQTETKIIHLEEESEIFMRILIKFPLINYAEILVLYQQFVAVFNAKRTSIFKSKSCLKRLKKQDVMILLVGGIICSVKKK